MRIFCLLALLLAVVLADSCTSDALPEPVELPCDNVTPTYEVEVREIVERTCAYSGCHLGGAPGLYNEYEGLLSDIESGEFRNRVVELRNDPIRGMPPSYAPAGRTDSLTQDELLIITCWLEAGHPRE